MWKKNFRKPGKTLSKIGITRTEIIENKQAETVGGKWHEIIIHQMTGRRFAGRFNRRKQWVREPGDKTLEVTMLRKEKHEQSLRDLWEAIRDQRAYHRNPGDTETAQSNTWRNITPDFPDLMKDLYKRSHLRSSTNSKEGWAQWRHTVTRYSQTMNLQPRKEPGSSRAERLSSDKGIPGR